MSERELLWRLPEPAEQACLVATTSLGDADGSFAAAAALAATAGASDRPAVLVEIADGRKPRPGAVASGVARALEEELNSRLSSGIAAARGGLCQVVLEPGEKTPGLVAELVSVIPADAFCVTHCDPTRFRELVEDPRLGIRGVLLRVDLDSECPLAALTAAELSSRRIRTRILKRPLGWLDSRRALSGVEPGRRSGAGFRRLARALIDQESGQALPLALGIVAVLVTAAIAMVAFGGALTGKARAQRSADLSALSGARSMRDDLPRLLAPPTIDGVPNPMHMSKSVYLMRARIAATRSATANGSAPWRVRIEFPDRYSYAPLKARSVIRASVDLGTRHPISVHATAEAGMPMPTMSLGGAGTGGMPAMASGGGYSGPLAYRGGKPMRPDVAAAFDRMAAAAAASGIVISVTSAFRSDAEQAALFAQHPDPTWVAPPGQSLHRCGTELDLGPSSAYSWLASNASRFGFLKRYSWEAWHFGFATGPAPCSAAGNPVPSAGGGGGARGAGGGDGRSGSSAAVPSFVPAQFRPAILDAAMKWNVPAAVLAAQLRAESGFNPGAVSSSGAQGIAQFMPGTAATYGLGNPFDPVAAIGAQAHLMSDLLKQFGSVELALAAYNAGPAAVERCGCVPSIPETVAYVARIMATLGGAGALLAPVFEVRLID